MTVFFREKYVRMFLQSLYVTLIESVENSRLFEKGLDKPIFSFFHGNRLAKNCAFRSSIWLRVIKDFTVSEDVYRHHFHEPVRIFASFRLEARHTESLEAFVFSNSFDFYDRHFGCMVRSLSVIVPELGSAMSIRLRNSEAAGIKPGSLYTISYAQPMPYVNRIHPVRTAMSEKSGQFLLSKIDSLKTSIDDLELFQSSLAFENFCEVECHQVGKRLLGAPVIISGYLEYVDIPFIHLRGCSGKRVMFYINNRHFKANSGITEGELQSLVGEPVSVLAVVWYGKRRDKLYPEVFMLERLERSEDPVQAEACGYIRLRAPLHARDLAAKFPHIGLPACSSIHMRGEIVDWEPEAFSNKTIYREFYPTLRQTRRKLRLGEPVKEMLAYSELLLDATRLKIDWLARRLRTERSLLDILLKLLMHQDKMGQPLRGLAELCQRVPGPARKSDLLPYIAWLRHAGLIASKQGLVVENKGIQVVFETVKTDLVRGINDIIQQGRVLTIDKLMRTLDMPCLLLLIGLETLERDGVVRRLDTDGLCWASSRLANSSTVMSEAEKIITEYEGTVLEMLRDVFHPLRSFKITEILQNGGYCISHHTVLKLLKKLKDRNEIVQQNGDMWEYPLEQRVIHFLKSHPALAFSNSQIVENIEIPLHLRGLLPKVLEQLSGKSAIWQPLDGVWAIKPHDENGRVLQIRNILLTVAKKHILDILGKGLPAQDMWLMGKIKTVLIPLAKKIGYSSSTSDIIADAISELIEQAKIKVSERGGYRWISMGKPVAPA